MYIFSLEIGAFSLNFYSVTQQTCIFNYPINPYVYFQYEKPINSIQIIINDW